MLEKRLLLMHYALSFLFLFGVFINYAMGFHENGSTFSFVFAAMMFLMYLVQLQRAVRLHVKLARAEQYKVLMERVLDGSIQVVKGDS